MRRKIKDTLIAGAIFGFLTGLMVLSGMVTSRYTRQAKVVAVSGDLVTVEEEYCGRLWQFYDGSAVYKLQDPVEMLMYTNGTDEDILDDVILKVNGRELAR